MYMGNEQMHNGPQFNPNSGLDRVYVLNIEL